MEPADGPIARFFDALNSHHLDDVKAALAPEFIFEEAAGSGAQSVEALMGELEIVLVAFPDISFRPVRQAVEGTRTYVEFRAVGTHRGEFVGVPPTGTVAIASGVFNFERADSRITRLRLTVDFGGLRRQLLMASSMQHA